jgi:hypothetical protein
MKNGGGTSSFFAAMKKIKKFMKPLITNSRIIHIKKK